MERIFRMIIKSGFPNEQLGQLLKMSLQYLDDGEIETDSAGLKVYFLLNIAKQIDTLKNDRKRKEKSRYESKK